MAQLQEVGDLLKRAREIVQNEFENIKGELTEEQKQVFNSLLTNVLNALYIADIEVNFLMKHIDIYNFVKNNKAFVDYDTLKDRSVILVIKRPEYINEIARAILKKDDKVHIIVQKEADNSLKYLIDLI